MMSIVKRYLAPSAHPFKLAVYGTVLLAAMFLALIFAWKAVSGAQAIEPEVKRFELWVTNHTAHKYGRVNLLNMELNSIHNVSPASGFANASAIASGASSFLVADTKAVEISDSTPEDIVEGVKTLDLESLTLNTSPNDTDTSEAGSSTVGDRANAADSDASSSISVEFQNVIYTAKSNQNGIEMTRLYSPDNSSTDTNESDTQLLEKSAPESGQAHLNRGLKFYQVGDILAISAGVTGEVWVLQNVAADIDLSRNIWKIVPSTLNGWQHQSNTQLQGETSSEQTHNICPSAQDVSLSEFGVRPNRVNIIPLTIGVKDPNPHDEVFITSIEVSLSDENAFLDTAISDNQKSVLTKVADVSSGYMHIIAHITDAGVDAKGVCDLSFSFNVSVHPDSQNAPPVQVGRALNAGELTFYNEKSIISENVLDSWLDPDGDDLALTDVIPSAALQAISDPDGELSARIKDVSNTAESLNLQYQVVDSFNARTSSELNFLTKPLDEYVPKSYTFYLQKDNGIELDLGVQSQRLGQKVALQSIQCQAAVKCTLADESVLRMQASAPGVHTLRYSFEGVKAPGEIRLHVLDDGQSPPLCAKSLKVTLMDATDTMLDLSSTFSGLYTSARSEKRVQKELLDGTQMASDSAIVKSIEVVPQLEDDLPNARIDAQIASHKQLHIGGQILKPTSQMQGVVFAGSVQVTWRFSVGENAKESVTRIAVFITANPVQNIILGDDFATTMPGEVIEVDVLKNDHTAYAANVLLDDSLSFDQDLTQGIAYVHGSKIRYISPREMPERVVIPFSAYIKGYYSSSRAGGFLTITKRGALKGGSAIGKSTSDESAGVKSQGADVSAGDITTEDMPSIANEDESAKIYSTAFGRYSQVYYNAQEEVSADLQDDTFASNDVKLKFEDLRLQQLELRVENALSAISGSILGADPRNSSSKNDLTQAKIESTTVIIPTANLPDVSVWEVKTGVYCQVGNTQVISALKDASDNDNLSVRGENAHKNERENVDASGGEICIDGDLLSTYTHYIVLRRSPEPIPASRPYVNDYTVTTDDLQTRNHFTKDMTPLTHGFSKIPQFEKLSLLNALANFSGSVLEGDLTDHSQAVLYKVLENNQTPDAKYAYGVVRIMAQHSISPKRSDSDVLQVKAGSTIRVDLEKRVQKLSGAKLETVSETWRHLEHIPANCFVIDSTLTYEAPNNVYEDAQDECYFKARFSTEQAVSTLSFRVRIIPQNTTPELKDGVVLAGVEPKGSVKARVNSQITWLGHTLSEIEKLNLNCSGDEFVKVNCYGTELTIEVDRTAKELSVHEIRLEIVDYQVVSKWRMRVLPTTKVGDLDLGEHSDTVVITQNSGTVQMDVSKEVRDLLNSDQLFGMQSGAYVRCGDPVNPYLKCKEGVKFGALTFWVENAPEGGGFEVKATYEFADRLDANGANSGVGALRIKYRSLPKTPSTIKVNAEAASSGVVQIDVSEQESYSIPEVTQFCLNVVELGSRFCQQSASRMVTFTSYDTLSMLSAWNTYAFTAYSVNEVGASSFTAPIIASPFTPLERFNIRALLSGAPGEEHQECSVQIIGVDANIISWSVRSALGDEGVNAELNNAEELKTYLEATSKQVETDLALRIIGKARKMPFTSIEVTPSVEVDFILPSTFNNAIDESIT